MTIDLHTHSNVSDGTDTPAELVAAAAVAGLDVVGLCDHDTMAGVPAAVVAGLECGVIVLRGLEMSTELSDATVHLLGYGCDPNDPVLAHALSAVRYARARRVPLMVDALNRAGVPLRVEDVTALAAPGATLGRPHVADALVTAGVVPSREEAFKVWLDQGRPGYVGHLRIPLSEGIAMIHGAGGVAVLAHPWGHGTRAVLTGSVIRGLARKDGLDGIEVDHNDHDAADRVALRAIAADAGLLVTGSSDYHGLGKVGHPLGCNTTAREVYEAIAGKLAA